MRFAGEVCVNLLLAVVVCEICFAVNSDFFAVFVGDFKEINGVFAVCGGDSAVINISAAADSVCV